MDSDTLLRTHWPTLYAAGRVAPPDPARMVQETDFRKKAKDAYLARKRTAHLQRHVLPDGRVILYWCLKTPHTECMVRWAKASCFAMMTDRLQLALEQPDLLCHDCKKQLQIQWEADPA